jgi:hypothetical protein
MDSSLGLPAAARKNSWHPPYTAELGRHRAPRRPRDTRSLSVGRVHSYGRPNGRPYVRAEVPSSSIDVKVHDGWVTLQGDVSFQFQSNAAYDDVSRLYGVAGVTNEIKVTNP